jgi:hypothetical protein
MRKLTVLSLILLASPLASSAPPTKSEAAAIPLTAGEIQREAWDTKQYPHLMGFLKSIDISKRVFPTDPRNAKFILAPTYFDPTIEMWSGFFKSCAEDHLTLLRAFGLLSREIKKRNVVVWGSGAAFEQAVAVNHIDLGLAIPAHNVGAAVWSPLPRSQDPDFELHMKVFYTEAFIHQFQDEVLPANLKVGYGDKQTYWYDGKQYTYPTVDADIVYGMKDGVGFRNIKGIGGQKRGFMGFMQKMLFFLPDAIHSMLINEKTGTMVTEAMINTNVKDFEKNPLYSVKIKE